MNLRDAIASSTLPPATRLAFIRALPGLSAVQLAQLTALIATHTDQLATCFATVAHDATLTPQARVEYVIHEVAKAVRTAAEAADVAREAAEMERLLREM